MSMEETRYYLNGIYLHVVKEDSVEKLRTVSTDGHRLSRVDMNMPEGANEIPGVIIPRKTIMEIRKLLEDHDDNINLSLSDNKIKLSIIEDCKAGKFTEFGKYKVERVDTTDGFKFFFDADTWLMIRPSGTEPLLRTYAEASNQEKVFDILADAKATIL